MYTISPFSIVATFHVLPTNPIGCHAFTIVFMDCLPSKSSGSQKAARVDGSRWSTCNFVPSANLSVALIHACLSVITLSIIASIGADTAVPFGAA